MQSKSYCSVGYHQKPPENLQEFAVTIRNGIFNNPDKFPGPPFLVAVVDSVINEYGIKFAAFRSGGYAQKGDYLLAKRSLMDVLDKLAGFVDDTADGDESVITLAGFTPTSTSFTTANTPCGAHSYQACAWC